MSPTDGCVIDASAVFRLLLGGSQAVAAAIARQPSAAPDLIRLEVANGLANLVRTSRIAREQAVAALAGFLELPIEIVSSEHLADPALRAALASGSSAYDAAYLVLAGERNWVLLTADRRLARIASRAELVD